MVKIFLFEAARMLVLLLPSLSPPVSRIKKINVYACNLDIKRVIIRYKVSI